MDYVLENRSTGKFVLSAYDPALDHDAFRIVSPLVMAHDFGGSTFYLDQWGGTWKRTSAQSDELINIFDTMEKWA